MRDKMDAGESAVIAEIKKASPSKGDPRGLPAGADCILLIVTALDDRRQTCRTVSNVGFLQLQLQCRHRPFFQRPLVHGSIVKLDVVVAHQFAEYKPTARGEMPAVAVGDDVLVGVYFQFGSQGAQGF